MNIFKRLFDWVQSAPVDFCYVTGEWGFKEKRSAKPTQSNNAFQNANNRRSPAARPTPVVAVAAACVAAPAAAPVVPADLFIPSAATDAQEQNAYS